MSCSLKLAALSFAYGDREVWSGVDLSVGHKEKVAIIGANGCGKTTILECIAGLAKPLSGQIELFHKPMISRADFEAALRQIGYLLQDADDHFLCPIVEDDVAFSLLANGISRDEAHEKTERILRELGIDALAKKVVYNLSGGEKKLVALAGVLIKEPSLLLLDEPTNALDYSYQLRLAEILSALEQSIVIVSHNQEFIERIVGKIYLLERGVLTLAADLKREILHSHDELPPHTHPHTH
ncbi:cobalt ABC transporter ATP-binding protein [Campylobacterota bacterium]|nr:cobalt ABC transporter ATP-binding protein [Campylobacterota bacterium]